MEKIDSLDRQILEIISQNARIPFKDVAAECGVSRAAIHQRVQRLIDLGVIIGSGYHVNPKSLGYRTCTYVGIKLEKGSMYKTVVAQLEKIPEVVECHFTTGPYTMLTKVYARDNEHLMDLLNHKMQEIPGVTATETLISLEQSINKEIQEKVSFSHFCKVCQRTCLSFPIETRHAQPFYKGNANQALLRNAFKSH